MVAKGGDGSCTLDVAGVGYEVFVPIRTWAQLVPSSEAVTLHIHTHVREEAFVLYGFLSVQDRSAFRQLIGVSSIGPKLALSILGVMDGPRLAAAIGRGERQAFRGIPGVGQKTVERMLVDLRDKLLFEEESPGSAQAPGKAPDDPRRAVVEVLVQMGYRGAEAERAVEGIDAEGKTTEVLLREALIQLAR